MYGVWFVYVVLSKHANTTIKSYKIYIHNSWKDMESLIFQLTSGIFQNLFSLNPFKAVFSNELFVHPIHFQFSTIWYFLINLWIQRKHFEIKPQR